MNRRRRPPRAAHRPVFSRWPLHPRPGPLESLSSWTSRLATVYGMRVEDLLGRHNLGLGEVTVPLELDLDPPEELLVALAERTGVGLDCCDVQGGCPALWR